MNLKEAFRYQNFISKLMESACVSIADPNHALNVVKKHHKSGANHDAVDIEEPVIVSEFYKNDDVISFIQWLILERDKLTKAINVAKVSAGFDIDAAIETNKLRQMAGIYVKRMLSNTASRSTERGSDYKFNAEGNQMPYFYEVEVVRTEAYDRDKAKAFMRSTVSDADKVSSDIDSVMINSVVEYEPVFDVNDSFEDVMAEFCKTMN